MRGYGYNGDEGVHIPYGEIKCDYKNNISNLINYIIDDDAFMLLRNILCCVYNYTSNIEDVNIVLNKFNPNTYLSTLDIHEILVNDNTIEWYKIFSYTCNFNFGFIGYNDLVYKAVKNSYDGGLSPEIMTHDDRLSYLCYDISYENYEKVSNIFQSGQINFSLEENKYPGVYMKLYGKNHTLPDTRIYFIFPLYLLKSQAWFANTIQHFGAINDDTITSFTMADYLSKYYSHKNPIKEIIFQYTISLKHLLFVVCGERVYHKLKPIVGDKLKKFENFERKKYDVDLFNHNDYPKIPLRLDYIPLENYGDIINNKTIYNILLNSGKTREEAKNLVRTVEKNKLIEMIDDNFNYNFANKAISHPPW